MRRQQNTTRSCITIPFSSASNHPRILQVQRVEGLRFQPVERQGLAPRRCQAFPWRRPRLFEWRRKCRRGWYLTPEHSQVCHHLNIQKGQIYSTPIRLQPQLTNLCHWLRLALGRTTRWLWDPWQIWLPLRLGPCTGLCPLLGQRKWTWWARLDRWLSLAEN